MYGEEHEALLYLQISIKGENIGNLQLFIFATIQFKTSYISMLNEVFYCFELRF